MASRTAREVHLVLFETHGFGRHDLIGAFVLEHTVLVNAGRVGERVRPHDRFVRLHRDIAYFAHQSACADYFFCVNTYGHVRKQVLPDLEGHDNLFERRISRALAEPVDRALDLASAVRNRGERIRRGHTEIVMTMHRNDRFVDIRHPIENRVDYPGKMLRCRIPDRIGDIDRRSATGDRGLHDTAQKIDPGTARVFRRKLHIAAQPSRKFDAYTDHGEHVIFGFTEFFLDVDRRCTDKGMNARPLSRLYRLCTGNDVLFNEARKSADHRAPYLARNGRYRFEIARRRYGKSRFDHVDLEPFKLPCDPELLLYRQT